MSLEDVLLTHGIGGVVRKEVIEVRENGGGDDGVGGWRQARVKVRAMDESEGEGDGR